MPDKRLTEKQYIAIQKIVHEDRHDGIFHAVERVIEAALEEISLDLGETCWVQWVVNIEKEIGTDE